MKVGIIGSRDFDDYSFLAETILSLLKLDEIDYIISGGAKGADKLGEYFADDNYVKKKIFYANWDKYGKRAGYLRNIDIVENSDFILAFWDGKSKGTKHSIELSMEHKKKIIVINYINNTELDLSKDTIFSKEENEKIYKTIEKAIKERNNETTRKK